MNIISLVQMFRDALNSAIINRNLLQTNYFMSKLILQTYVIFDLNYLEDNNAEI